MTEEQVYEVKRAYDTGCVKGYQLAEKKYKEVIDKAIDLLESQSQDMMGNYYFDDNIAEQLLIILKEVE